MATTWRELCGPVCIYLDGEWKKGNLLEIHENHVVYSLAGDTDEFIITKDEARAIIRDRKMVSKKTGSGSYTGSNPLVFGPGGTSIYGKKIVERKDRPNTYRVEIKYKPLTYSKAKTFRIALGKHVFFFCFCQFSINAMCCLIVSLVCLF